MNSKMPDWQQVEALLDAALELPPEDQASFVRGQTSDPALIAEVLSLLNFAESSEQFLEAGHALADDDGAPMDADARLGAWRIDGIIGRGGMGTVYRVRRADGLYEQEAALKLMRPLAPEHLALFESERQFLARLEHPGIARLLDGGGGADGRPWMVMEYASGAPVDVWARQTGAGPREILGAMLQVCEAMVHAHGKLIVHRDIKPSNILIDETGRARVIDFGVARIAGGDGIHVAPLSLDYAAPELFSGEAATTASDVYGLAATLYALLAGRPPLALSDAPVPTLARRAVEEVPPPLSAHIPKKDQTALIRDLDAILAKALARNPADRYPAVEAFREDLTRALAGQAVSARSQERGYVMGRFLSRNRWQAAAAAALVASMGIGLSASLWQAREARIERDTALREQARLEAVQQYLYFMLRDAADTAGGTETSAREILETAAGQVTDMFATDPARGGPVMHTLAELYLYLGDYEAAAPLLKRIVAAPETEPSVRAAAHYDLSQYHLRTADLDAAEELLTKAQAFWSEDAALWRRRLVDSRLVEARILRDRGEIESAIALLQEHLPERIRLSGEHHRHTGVFYNDLGVMLNAAGRREEAAASLRQALEVWRVAALDNSPDALNTLNNLAAIETLSGRPEAAEPLFREAVQLRNTLYGASAATSALLNNYGKTLLRLGRADEALPFLRQASEMALEHAGPGSLHYASAIAGVSEALSDAGEQEKSFQAATEGYTAVTAAVGEAHPAAGIIAIMLGRANAEAGDVTRAAELLAQAERALAPLGAGAASQIDIIRSLRDRYDLPQAVQ
ncbi:serine/threonine protein kinase [Hyphomonas neptunium ATCC 15444]|uniref:Serine/threonine protein kinase n=3 Tax=Hyphomonadaceae TaxID=69657 RepID=Q0C0A2_HYPNA|nr:serine/threonine protein kinase [Hyphomonas neptunium ATCC 15444]KCZ90578.1 serine/threonine protein kinase [Hyphomonas hirschiana VP5]